MRHVGRVLPKAVENAEVLRAGRAAAVMRRWDEVVGPLLAEKSTPDRYDKGTVWVATQGSAWAQELRLMKPRILERMEAMAGERGMFVDVRFGVRPPRAASAVRQEEEAETQELDRRLGAIGGASAILPISEERIEKGPLPVPPEPEVKDPEAFLSIRERAARRLANWPKGE